SGLAGRAGAPGRNSPGAAVYRQGPGNEVESSGGGPGPNETPAVFHLLLPHRLAGSPSAAGFADALRTQAGHALVHSVIGGAGANPAQDAVAEAILHTSTLPPGTPVAAAARRFAAMPAAVRHAWLMAHVAALRAGH